MLRNDAFFVLLIWLFLSNLTAQNNAAIGVSPLTTGAESSVSLLQMMQETA
jgi:hypothetical protein